MALFRKRRDKKEKFELDEVNNIVAEIVDDQPRNPFTEFQLLNAHSDIVHLLTVIDDRRFASAADDNAAVIWDARTGCRLQVLLGHTRPITCMLIFYQSQKLQSDDPLPLLLLTGSSDKTIRVWDEEGHALQTYTDHNSSVKCLVNVKDENMFYSGGQNLCLWNKQGELLCQVERKAEHSDIHTLLPIKNNRIIAASNKASLVVYSVTTVLSDDGSHDVKKIIEYKKLPFHHRESIRCLVSIAVSMFASASLDGAIVLWSTHSLNCTKQFNSVENYEGPNHMYPNSIQSVFTVDQKYLLASVGHGFALYDVMLGKCIAQVQNAHYGKVVHSIFVSNGFILVTCSEDGTLRLWGSPTPILVEEGTNSCSFSSPVEKFLGLSSKEIQKLKKPVEPALLGECLAHSGTVHMALDCGDEGFASCGSDGLVVLWKDGVLQSERRNKMVQNILLSGAAMYT